MLNCKKMMKRGLVLFTLVACASAEARWATEEDAPYEIEFYKEHTTVAADGSSETVAETQWHILKDHARSSVGTQSLYYNPGWEQIEVLEAKTLFSGKSYAVDSHHMENK